MAQPSKKGHRKGLPSGTAQIVRTDEIFSEALTAYFTAARQLVQTVRGGVLALREEFIRTEHSPFESYLAERFLTESQQNPEYERVAGAIKARRDAWNDRAESLRTDVTGILSQLDKALGKIVEEGTFTEDQIRDWRDLTSLPENYSENHTIGATEGLNRILDWCAATDQTVSFRLEYCTARVSLAPLKEKYPFVDQFVALVYGRDSQTCEALAIEICRSQDNPTRAAINVCEALARSHPSQTGIRGVKEQLTGAVEAAHATASDLRTFLAIPYRDSLAHLAQHGVQYCHELLSLLPAISSHGHMAAIFQANRNLFFVDVEVLRRHIGALRTYTEKLAAAPIVLSDLPSVTPRAFETADAVQICERTLEERLAARHTMDPWGQWLRQVDAAIVETAEKMHALGAEAATAYRGASLLGFVFEEGWGPTRDTNFSRMHLLRKMNDAGHSDEETLQALEHLRRSQYVTTLLPSEHSPLVFSLGNYSAFRMYERGKRSRDTDRGKGEGGRATIDYQSLGQVAPIARLWVQFITDREGEILFNAGMKNGEEKRIIPVEVYRYIIFEGARKIMEQLRTDASIVMEVLRRIGGDEELIENPNGDPLIKEMRGFLSSRFDVSELSSYSELEIGIICDILFKDHIEVASTLLRTSRVAIDAGCLTPLGVKAGADTVKFLRDLEEKSNRFTKANPDGKSKGANSLLRDLRQFFDSFHPDAESSSEPVLQLLTEASNQARGYCGVR